jgi:hypothetical protein
LGFAAGSTHLTAGKLTGVAVAAEQVLQPFVTEVDCVMTG